jgi:hypothetical protein
VVKDSWNKVLFLIICGNMEMTNPTDVSTNNAISSSTTKQIYGVIFAFILAKNHFYAKRAAKDLFAKIT